MFIFFESLMMKCGSQMCLISIWIQGSHVHKARNRMQCGFGIWVFLWHLPLNLSENHNRCENYDEDNLI